MPGPAFIGQTITVMDRSGNVLKQSKTLLGVLKDAKNAYQEKKVEIMTERKAKAKIASDARIRNLQGPEIRVKSPASARVRTLDGEDLQDRQYGRSSRSRSTRPTKTERKASHRDDSFFIADPYSQSSNQQMIRSTVNLPHNSTTAPPSYHSNPPSPRPTNQSPYAIPRKPSPPVDMDLAYGPYHAPSLQKSAKDPSPDEILEKCGALTTLLTEANCVQHSVTKTIANLQKNPDTLAAVGLTLAEISTMISKLAPGALLSLKGLFPAVFALLAAPEFLIAVGVAAGVTVVVFGGYKIVKKIKAKKARRRAGGEDLDAELDGLALEDEDEEEDEEEEEEEEELSRVDRWRRGISIDGAEEESVDEEFISPRAAKVLVEQAAQKQKKREKAERKRREEEEEENKRSEKKREKESSSRERKVEKERVKEREQEEKERKRRAEKERKVRRDGDGKVAVVVSEKQSRPAKAVSNARLLLVRT